MRILFQNVAFFKYVDICLQVAAFLVMVLLLCYPPSWGPYALFIEAGVQVLSCLFWTVYFSVAAPGYRAGVVIRRVFLIVLGVWLLSYAVPPVFLVLLYSMILLGPVLGTIYFVITVKEARYYRKARKPFFLI